MKLQPLLDKIVVKEIKQDCKQTESGILLPSSADEKPVLAEVIAVGNGGIVDGEEVKILLNVGDKVIFSRFSGTEYKLENQTFIILKQADILAKVVN